MPGAMYVRRGNQLIELGSTTEAKPQAEAEEPKEETIDKEKVTANYKPPLDSANHEFDYITALLKAKGSMDSVTIAECIVGQIRNIYFRTSVRIPRVTDLEIMNYMDKILFDTLRKVLASAIRYGTSAVPIELVLKLIENAVYSVDYQVNIEAMNGVIYKIYSLI